MIRSLMNRLPGVVLLCLASLPALADPPKAERNPTDTTPEGAWRLVAYKSGNAQDFTRLPKDWEQTKLVIGGRFVWTLAKEGKVVRAVGGKYTIQGDRYTERVEFVLDDKDKWLHGHDQRFQWKIEGKTWRHTGTLKGNEGEVKMSEVWERVEPAAQQGAQPDPDKPGE